MIFYILIFILHFTKAVRYSNQFIMIIVSAFGAFSVISETAGSAFIFGENGIWGFLLRTAAVILILIPFIIQNVRPADGIGTKTPVSDEFKRVSAAQRLIISGLVGVIIHTAAMAVFILIDKMVSDFIRPYSIASFLGDILFNAFNAGSGTVYELWEIITGAADTAFSIFAYCAFVSFICLIFSGIYIINGVIRTAGTVSGKNAGLYIFLSFIPVVNIVIAIIMLSEIAKRKREIAAGTV